MIVTITVLFSLIVVTYFLYPAGVILLGRMKSAEDFIAEFGGRIFLFMSAHNEEAVLEATLDALSGTEFPKERLVCFIGSDASSDRTVEILRHFAASSGLNIRFMEFDQRQGKPNAVNKLVEWAHATETIGEEDLFLMADANIILDPGFISQLSAAFTDPKTGLADGVISDASRNDAIAGNERQYLRLETQMKQAESLLWGCAMGPFGGAYMIRPHLYTPVPENFLVDDFFIFYNIIRRDFRSKVVATARCTEAISGSLEEEFRRKTRISAGNFQNAVHFLPEVIRFWKMHNLVFILHKLLRWLSPVFMVIILFLLALLTMDHTWAAKLLLIMICLLVGIPLINYLLNKLNLRSKWLQGLSYLIIMNLALLAGFFKYLKGVRTNVWEPTKRAG